jgi:hypothetical protein
MTDASLSGTVEQLEEKINAVGYTETEIRDLTPPEPDTDTEEETESESKQAETEPPRVFGILVEVEAGPGFYLIVEEETAYAKVQASYQLWQDIAAQIDPERAEKLVETADDEPVPEDHPIRELIPVDEFEIPAEERRSMLAAVNLLEGMTEDTRTELIYQLTDLFTASEVKHRVDTPPNHRGITSFAVYDKVFVSESVSLHDLSRTIERVRMATHRATIFLRYAFDLGVDMERTQNGPVNEEPAVANNAPAIDVPKGTDETPG